MLKRDSLSLVGSQSERAVSGYHVDMAICSCMGIDNNIGITESNEYEAEVKKAFLKSAGKKVLALDSTKFDKALFVKVCNFSYIDMLVTDKKPSDIWLERLKKADVKVLFEAQDQQDKLKSLA
jgi:DeoR/GlpR family transcriptional regulator of sugar metabolism